MSSAANLTDKNENPNIIEIGGGLAGPTISTFLARAGKSVTSFEQSTKEIGGRARTSVFDGFYFNQGAHVLFLSDAGAAVLLESELQTARRYNVDDTKNGWGYSSVPRFKVIVCRSVDDLACI
jgi:phytoene dehydrogenase-like protein